MRPAGETRFPIRFLTVAVGVTELMLLGFAVSTHHSYRALRGTAARNLQIDEIRATVLYFNEALVMSARMAAATADPRWEARYREVEPQLDAAIRQANELAPEVGSRAAAIQTEKANERLVALEGEAFALIKAGRAGEAAALLDSDECRHQKAVYAEGLERMRERLLSAKQRMLESSGRQITATLTMVALAAPWLLVAWLATLRGIERWHRLLVEQREQLDRQAQALSAQNRTLDELVAERTHALEASRQEALQLMRAAEQAKGTLEQVNSDFVGQIEHRRRAEFELQGKVKELELLNRIMMDREERILDLKERLKALQPSGSAKDGSA